MSSMWMVLCALVLNFAGAFTQTQSQPKQNSRLRQRTGRE